MVENGELVVVGAGPAGMEAAATAAEAGVGVTLIDGYPRMGGQYFKQVPCSFSITDHTTQHKRAEGLFHRVEKSGVRLLTDTTVWGAFPLPGSRRTLLTLSSGHHVPGSIRAETLIVAAGAYDRPLAFSGWTLPGVMTAGAAHTLLKSQWLLPGRRILLSGTGPLQLATAALLSSAGAQVVGVLEGAFLGWKTFRSCPALWGQWTRLREGWDYWRTLHRRGVPLKFGWSVVEARGDGKLREAVAARLDGEWAPIPGSRQTLSVDTLILGYGFIPWTQLTRLLGCRHDFVPERGGCVPCRDEQMQTSVPGVYAIGDGAGIGGAELAILEGRVAGLAAARQLGRLSKDEAGASMAILTNSIARERRFAHMLCDMFTPGQGLYTLADDDTMVCRCEEVRLGEIRKAISDGARSVTEVKGITRAGMGYCQGRMCGEFMARIISRETSVPLKDLLHADSLGTLSVRPPLHPLPVSVLAEAGG